jgi:hypothetical protein
MGVGKFELIMGVGKFEALFALIPFTIFVVIYYCVMFGIVGKHRNIQTEISSLLLQLNSTLNNTTKFSHLCVPSAVVGLPFMQFTNMNLMCNLTQTICT